MTDADTADTPAPEAVEASGSFDLAAFLGAN